MRALRKFLLLAMWIVVAALIPTRGRGQAPARGVDAVLHAFDQHSIVLLGEIHWNASQHSFIQKLLHDPRLPRKVNDIAVEFGNSLYQPVIDRYVAGETVPMDSLKMAWQNTTVPMTWDRPIYGDVYRAIREVNRKLPASKRMRVIALDPPIEWSKVNSMADFPRIWGYRDPLWFTTLEQETLSKGRSVLVIAGALHIIRRDPPDFKPRTFDKIGLGDALAQRYGRQTYRIFPAIDDSPLGKLMRRYPAGTLLPVDDEHFGRLSSQMLWGPNVTMLRTVNGKTEPYTLSSKDYPPLGSLIDAIMYYGPRSSTAKLAGDEYDSCAYVTELRRRNTILLTIFGMDQAATIDSLAPRDCHPEVRVP